MTYSIFYDLETTDTLTSGQIINFSFIAVDEDYNEIERFTDTIKISRLQLPTPGAVLANKVDVIDHQKTATYTEFEAVKAIRQFLLKYIEMSGGHYSVNLIGYNSNSFDNAHIRTSFIRNGFNPYVGVNNRDVMHVATRIKFSNAEYVKMCEEFVENSHWDKVRNKLEFHCQMLGILEGEQTHFSEDDVLWTIDLARRFKDDYGIDVRGYSAYEVAEIERERGKVFKFKTRSETKDSPAKYKYFSPHSTSGRNSIFWIDLEEARKIKKKGEDLIGAIKYKNRENAAMYREYEYCDDSELQQLADDVIKAYPQVSMDKLFPPSECDIEADIYRIAFNRFNVLQDIMLKKMPAKGLNQDEMDLVKRFRISNFQGEGDQEAFKSALKDYAEYRYGGTMIAHKQYGTMHPTLDDLLDQLEKSKKEVETDRDIKLMESLEKFYKESEIYMALKG